MSGGATSLESAQQILPPSAGNLRAKHGRLFRTETYQRDRDVEGSHLRFLTFTLLIVIERYRNRVGGHFKLQGEDQAPRLDLTLGLWRCVHPPPEALDSPQRAS